MTKNTFLYATIVYLLCGSYCLAAIFYYKEAAVLPVAIPSLYFVITLIVACMLYRKLRHQLHIALLLFLLTVALSYVSFVPAQMYEPFGFLLYNTASLASISFLAHFLKDYFSLLGISWSYISSLKFFYSFPISAFICSVGALIIPSVTYIVEWITILLFAIGLCNIFGILLFGYMRSHAIQLQWLIGLCVIPLMPFLLCYVVPTLLKKEPLLYAEIAALFFSAIPIGFIAFQLDARLFANTYYISRLRYLTLFVITFSTLLSLCFYVFTKQITISILFCLLTITMTSCLLLLKERLEIRMRTKEKLAASVTEQQIFQAVKKAPSPEKLLYELTGLLKKHLQVDAIFFENKHAPLHVLHLENGIYTIGIQSNLTLQIGDRKQFIRLLRSEMQFIELLASFVDTTLQHIHIVTLQPSSLDVEKMAWHIVEQEKRELAQQLHDTILQEQIQIARQLDESDDIREQLLDINFELREFCETLHPPLLEAVGLEAALQKFVQKVKLRADFNLVYAYQLTGVVNDSLALMIYRTAQELLNNAMKHSQANKVELSITIFDSFYTIHYKDDGIGFTESPFESFGLSGLKQRHELFGGVVRKVQSDGTIFIISNRKEHIDAYSRSR